MTTQVLDNKVEVQAQTSSERESLSLLASRIFWLTASLLAGAFCLDFVGAPSEAATFYFLSGVILAVVLEPAITIAFQHFLNNRAVRPYYIAAKVIGSLNAGGMVGVIALFFGDVALVNVAPGVAACAGLLAAGIAGGRVSMPDNGPRITGGAVMESERPLSEQDRYLAAIHEAGHALTLALVPEDRRAGAFVQIGGSQSTFTHVPRDDAMWTIAPYRRWEMLLLLAGPVATDLHFGASTEGGRHDMVSWRHKALSVLTAERVQGFSPQPGDEVEYERNERLIAQMETQQSAALTEFFRINNKLYYSLVEFLNENGGASEGELESFLIQVADSEMINEALSDN